MTEDTSRDAVAAQGPLQDAAGADVREPLVMPRNEFEIVRKVALCSTCLHGAVLELTLTRAEAAEAKLAEVRTTVGTFRAHYAGSLSDQAADLAEGIRQVLDRDKGSDGETLSATCTGCGQLFTDSETDEYLFASRERMGRLLDGDGWTTSPVVCPACQPGGST